MDESPETEPAQVRALRRLVTALTLTMIAGVVVVATALVIRLGATAPALPDSIALPGGARAVAFTQGPDWYAVTTDDDRILIFDRATGELRQEIAVE
ncbi:DUF6476 family protein [Rhodosalinus sp. K401]|uniref:DUF6476 family protein n=1 Tax=Rhodosalinus sp. K401 TaxID=3239195 RepID=UPI0035233A90